MSKYTPEPWVLFEVGDRLKHQSPASSDKTSILTVASEGDVQFGAVYNDEDARRIVACVNACAGIPTEILELDEKSALACREHVQKLKSVVAELVSTMASLLNDYKDTLEGLNYYRVNDFDSRDGDYRDAYDADDSAVLAEKLIEKIKGGAA